MYDYFGLKALNEYDYFELNTVKIEFGLNFKLGRAQFSAPIFG